MTTVLFDAYDGWSEDRLKRRCRELLRLAMKKDMLICMLVESGGVDAMPKDDADEVRRIVSAYCDDGQGG
jgi:hypothetical protein